MTFKRNYLTSNEIAMVVTAMLDEPNEFKRQITKYGFTAFLLIEEYKDAENEDGTINSGEIYDELIANAIDLDEKVINLSLVDRIVKQELSINKILEEALVVLNAKLDEGLKKFDTQALKEAVGELQTLAK